MPHPQALSGSHMAPVASFLGQSSTKERALAQPTINGLHRRDHGSNPGCHKQATPLPRVPAGAGRVAEVEIRRHHLVPGLPGVTPRSYAPQLTPSRVGSSVDVGLAFWAAMFGARGRRRGLCSRCEARASACCLRSLSITFRKKRREG